MFHVKHYRKEKMNTDFIDNDYLKELSYLQYLLYQDNYYTLEEYKQIRKLLKKLIRLLERGNKSW